MSMASNKEAVIPLIRKAFCSLARQPHSLEKLASF